MSYQVINPFVQFVDPINGKPLSGGSVYFGRQDTDPKNQPANRINVYAVQDNGTEVLLAQPITLNGAGQPQYSGSVKQIKVELYGSELTYSVQVFSQSGSQKGYSPRVAAVIDSFELGRVDSSVKIAGIPAVDIKNWSYLAKLFGDSVLFPESFGAVAGESDSTAKLQAAINALPAFGILYGGGKEYNVRSLLLKSNMEILDIKLKTIAGAIDFVSPITIIGETTAVRIDGVLTTNYPQGAKTNIKLRKVGINGNRQNQTSIDSPIEDGGRHGVRILGRVTNTLIDECSIEFCGTDGVEFFSNNSRPTNENVDSLCFSNVIINNSKLSSNRRHGISGDSMFNVKLNAVDSKRNGLDLDTTSPLNSGMRGARFAGNLYGRPFDFEGYGIGSRIVLIEVIGGDFTGNAAGALFYDTAPVTDVNFQPRKDITITGATFDSTDGANPDSSMAIYSTTATASVQGYENINMANCTFKTWINLEGVKDINIVGGSAKARYAADTYFARVNNCRNWFFRSIYTNKNAIIATPALPFTPVWTNVFGSPVFTSQTFTLIGFTSNGWLCRYNSVYTVPSTGNYFGTISVSGCKAIPQSAGGASTATGAAFDVSVTTGAGDVVNVPYVPNTTASQGMEILFEVVPNA